MHVLGTLNGIRVRWSMRVLRWVKQSLCSLSVLNVGWEDGEGEGAELLEGICWCYANHVCHIAVKVCRVAGHPVEVCRVAGHRAEMRRVAGHPVEVRRVAVEMHHLAAHLVESRHLSGRAAEVCRLTDRAMEVRRPTDRAMEVRRLTDRAMEVCRLTDRAMEVCRLSGRAAEVRRPTGRAAEVCRLTDRAMEVRRLTDRAMEVRHVADHPVELRRLSAEMRHLAEHLADFAVKQGSSCLYSLGTASMYCFFLFAFTRQLESPFTCHQIVSNGSLQATRVQSSAAATPNGRVRIGEDEGVPERKAYTQSLQ
ncbi:hypothetical protein BLSTO_04017 [Blastocystis sp. subtype 1]